MSLMVLRFMIVVLILFYRFICVVMNSSLMSMRESLMFMIRSISWF